MGSWAVSLVGAIGTGIALLESSTGWAGASVVVTIGAGVWALWLASESHKANEDARLKAEAEKIALETAIAAANRRADEANEQAAASGKKAVEASRLAEAERLERIKIQEGLGPRRLTADQHREL